MKHLILIKKYLVPSDLTMGQFLNVIRQRIKVKDSSLALFLLVNGKIYSLYNRKHIWLNTYLNSILSKYSGGIIPLIPSVNITLFFDL